MKRLGKVLSEESGKNCSCTLKKSKYIWKMKTIHFYWVLLIKKTEQKGESAIWSLTNTILLNQNFECEEKFHF